MQFLIKTRFFAKISLMIIIGISSISACNPITAESTSLTSSSTSSLRFAEGTKGVKIMTHDTSGGSFVNPSVVPALTTIPSTHPGGDGTSTYIPGVSATTFYNLDGSGQISQPSWLLDFQMGITSTSYSSACAAFGGGFDNLDPANFYRVSERDCSSVTSGVGGGSDPVFFRLVLDRDHLKIGSGENLLIQVEYQASGLHLNSDGTGTNAEDNLDQLWKIYWNTSLAASVAPKAFGLFIPPNYSACHANGTGNDGPGSCPLAGSNTYRGSSIKVKQFMIPLSAYPDMKVIQFTRVKSRINAVGINNYVSSFCNSNQPLCLGVVIRSVTIMRM